MRLVTGEFRTALEASSSGELGIVFATVTHPDLETAIQVTSDVMDYVLNGVTFNGAAFGVSLLTDDDSPPIGQATIINVDQEIGAAVQRIKTQARLKLEIYARSDFDGSNPRLPIGTPSLQYSADGLFLRNIRCDVMTLTGDISTYDIASEPWPAIRSTIDRLPGLYARAPVSD